MVNSKTADTRMRAKMRAKLGQWWALLLAGIMLAMMLLGCGKDEEEEKQCNAVTSDEAACAAVGSFCFWVGCVGESYRCTSGVSASTSCTCDSVINETAGEQCSSANHEDCTSSGTADSRGCGCKMCTTESVTSGGFGRKFTTKSGVLSASIVAAPLSVECDWIRWPNNTAREVAPAAGHSGEEWDTEIALYYQNAGLAEHASVASFSRAVLELMEYGAPPGILDRTLAAAREEVHHAQMAFALARAWSSKSLRVTGIDGLLAERKGDGLADLAKRVVTEACAGETPAVLKMAVAYRFAQNEKVREYLRTTLVEERRHAELAWATVAWAMLSDAQGSGQVEPQEKRAVLLATSNALASTSASLWLQANASSIIDRHSKKAGRLLQVGILPPSMEAAVAQIAAPMVERLRAELLSEQLLANGLDHFESLVHQQFEHALVAVDLVVADIEHEKKQVV
eukprot:TRINITY_DN43261_c0_g1_i1.p1 TRINITY_DN43261_c0_g1~~TRINITY_DN43261_c0_g1_i1.p1  ORF type:complete len:467 (-),score=86.59 TRINITY_DN43261_c0_g1_i1:78-1442(-)